MLYLDKRKTWNKAFLKIIRRGQIWYVLLLFNSARISEVAQDFKGKKYQKEVH